MSCNQLNQLLGINAISGSKLSLKKVAEVLSKLTDTTVLVDELDQLDEAGVLKIHRMESFQGSEEDNYNRSFVTHTRHMKPPDSRFKDYIAWVIYDDLCEYASSIATTNKLSLDQKEKLEFLEKSDTYNRMVKAVLDIPVIEEFKNKNKPLSAYKNHLEKLGLTTNDREKQVFGAIVREIYNYGKKPKG